MHFEIEGQTVELAEDWRIGELVRAENALDIDMETAKLGAKTALVIYISMARVEQWKPGAPGNRGLADTVMRMDISVVSPDAEAAEVPLDGAVDPQLNGDQAKDSESDDQKTSGLLRSGSSA